MNREILFKGFHPCENGFEKVFVNGEWINGLWVEGAYMPHYYSSRYGKISAIFVNDDVEDKTYRYPIIPEIVGQYTGLTDKNGKKIFEGDIINDIDYGVMRCVYLHGSFVWYKEDGFKIECMRYIPVIEVIGNIHSNPELLEAAE